MIRGCNDCLWKPLNSVEKRSKECADCGFNNNHKNFTPNLSFDVSNKPFNELFSIAAINSGIPAELLEGH